MRVRNVLSFVWVIAIIIGVFWAGWNIICWIAEADPRVAGPTITAMLGFIGLIYGQWHSKSREIQQSHRPKKIEVYELFFDILQQTLKETESKNDIVEEELSEELKDKFWELNRGLIVWASPPVLEAWLNFKLSSGNKEKLLTAMDEMLQAIRKDLGNSNLGLAKHDSLKVFLNNPEELDKLYKK